MTPAATIDTIDAFAPDINWPDPDWMAGYPREARWAMAPDILADHLRRLGFSMERRRFADDDFSAAVVPMHTAMTAKSPSTNVLLVTEEYVDRERGHARGYKGAYEDMKARAESAEAEIDGLTARAEKAEADLAALTAERKANAVDALAQAILDTLQTLASAWPKAEIPSSRLWAAVVDRGAVATVRPGQAAEGEAHRFYKAKMALIRDGLMTESRGFVRLASAPSSSAESEPTFQD